METTRSDQELLQQVRNGDRSAFEILINRHQSAIYGYFCARLAHFDDAEDLTQEVFLRCYQGLDRFEGDQGLRPWLFGIAKNLLREHARKVSRRKEVAWTELCLELDELHASSDAMYEDLLTYLPRCMESLGPSAKTALQLHYGAKKKLNEIAEQLRRSEGAVKLLMYRARQALKQCLGRQLPRSSPDSTS
ncbi:RNA polymerase ECF-type sigma factor [Planctomycetales bacterium 10988]|nr:RNA polymerase ECF-type sigma factor [Planctomycetales bacterium 10988]